MGFSLLGIVSEADRQLLDRTELTAERDWGPEKMRPLCQLLECGPPSKRGRSLMKKSARSNASH